MNCINCGKKLANIHHVTKKGNRICQKCLMETDVSKEKITTKMMSYQNGRGRATTEEELIEKQDTKLYTSGTFNMVKK
jgi:DNA-directed RNA polymerase subunit M/transcription elongation factor TFIIS